MRVRSLGQEDPLEEEMATHSKILAWRIPWTEEPGPQRTETHHFPFLDPQPEAMEWVMDWLDL